MSVPAAALIEAHAFVDTNILIYAHNLDAGTKHEIAEAVLHELWSERIGILSLQVLQQFYVKVTRENQRNWP